MSTMNSLSCLKDTVELSDLPDELILIIMNKVKPLPLLLCSVITVGNNRLEQLVLNKCHSIDLTFDYYLSSYTSLIQRFYTHVLHHINNNIHSLVFNIEHIPHLIAFDEKNSNRTFPNLTHLKIMMCGKCSKTGTPYTLGNNVYSFLRHSPLFSTIPQFYILYNNDFARILSMFHRSSLMRSIESFELDDNCILLDIIKDDGLFFPQSIRLTHIRITLHNFDHCVCLLNQMSAQLCSLTVSIMYVYEASTDILSKIKSISCPNLKQLTISIYRNMSGYDNFFLSVIQRLSNVEYLTLLLTIGYNRIRSHFLDGLDLEKDILSYMPHLRQFQFHIRSILKNPSHINIDTIRQTFIKYQQQSVDCAIDYFNNDYGQCQIYSLPFIGTRLDFISNRFPLFDIHNRFSMVTMLLLFDDIQPFESHFFTCVSRVLPHLRTLEILNKLKQQEIRQTTTDGLEFARLATLILFDIHLNYAEQFLCRTYLPCLVELAIDNDMVLTIINQDHQQARDNCSRVETLRTPESFNNSTDTVRNFFSLASNLEC